jgi:hypothetical protein
MRNSEKWKLNINRTRTDWFPGVVASCDTCGVKLQVAGAWAATTKRPGQEIIVYYCDTCGDDIRELEPEGTILYQRGAFWVSEDDDRFTVWREGMQVAFSDSAYAHTDDGLSLARVRVDDLAYRRAQQRREAR